LKSKAPADPTPSWARNGSYLVVRRLRQDVGAFWSFVRAQAAALATKPGFEGMTPERLASLFVGRWPSGAPLARTPDRELEPLGADSCANNAFAFHTAYDEVAVTGCPPDMFPVAIADPDGVRCPYAAHIRKVNPRADGTDTAGMSDVFTHALLRRGIPYGEPFTEGEPPGSVDRGLLFLSYQSSIKNQFSFLIQHWVNRSDAPHGKYGHDPIIGQNRLSPGRERFVTLRAASGAEQTVELPQDFVVPTGGGYFFAPSISALEHPLSST